jgi:hypothetical protein
MKLLIEKFTMPSFKIPNYRKYNVDGTLCYALHQSVNTLKEKDVERQLHAYWTKQEVVAES